MKRYYTPDEAAKLWHLSANTIRSMFREHPQVLKIPRSEKLHKRGYCSIRIPESILKAKIAELCANSPD